MLEIKRSGVKSQTASQRENTEKPSYNWLIYALLAAVFASLVAILGRVGVADINANLWTAIRTIFVVPLSWVMVMVTGGQRGIMKVTKKSWLFLILSGTATGGSWLFFYHALQVGPVSHVVPIDKLSILLTMGFARLFLGERFSKQSVIGLGLLTVGTLLPIIF